METEAAHWNQEVVLQQLEASLSKSDNSFTSYNKSDISFIQVPFYKSCLRPYLVIPRDVTEITNDKEDLI